MNIDRDLFDRGVNRENTGCYKWDMRLQTFGRADVIPMGVADMDFAAPQSVLDALMERVAHGAFGYSAADITGRAAVVRWMRARHGVELEEKSILFSPGVVDSLNVAVAAFTRPADSVAVMTPVYGPFYSAVERNGRRVMRCPLREVNHQWFMDMDSLERAFQLGAKALLLCNPHNPVGRIWTEDEMQALADLARRYGVIIISDEIHADLEMPGHQNTSILKVEPRAVALISATKTFNLAALRHSSVLIPNTEVRNVFQEEYQRRGIDGINLMGSLAQRVAYETGAPWLDALLAYLDGTRREVEAYLAAYLPEIHCARLEGTYLMWLDMRELGMGPEELEQWVVQKAGLGLNSGTAFGHEGAGFMRMNIATPRARVMQAMEQLRSALRG